MQGILVILHNVVEKTRVELGPYTVLTADLGNTTLYRGDGIAVFWYNPSRDRFVVYLGRKMREFDYIQIIPTTIRLQPEPINLHIRRT